MVCSFRTLSYSYTHGTPVPSDLDFDMDSTRVTGLAGANGSGKSTVIGILTALLARYE